DERRLHVVAASGLRRPGDAPSEQDLGPFAFRHVHVTEDLLLVILRRERPELRRLLERIPDPDGSHPLREALEEGIPNRLVDEETRAGDAGLTLVVVSREKGSLDRGIEVRVLEDHVGPLASEFQERLLQVRGARLDDLLADFDGSGEADLVDARVAGEQGADDGALPRD